VAKKRRGKRKLREAPGYQRTLAETTPGVQEEHYLVPINESFEAEMRRKQGLIARVGAALRSWFRPRVSEPVQGATTETGTSAAFAASYGDGLAGAIDSISMDSKRRALYRDYEKIDKESVELSRALTVTVRNVFMSREGDENSYKISSKDAHVLKMLQDLDKRVEMRKELPSICRSYLLYGDEFEEPVVDEAMSIVRIKWLNQHFMRRHEDEYGRLDEERPFTMVGEDGSLVATFAPFQVIHMRYDRQRGDMYGRSFLFTARKSWRQLSVCEDGMLMAVVSGAADRLLVKVPYPPTADDAQARKLVKQAKEDMKRSTIIDQTTGKLDLRKAVIADSQEIFMGVPADNPGAAGVERLAGGNASTVIIQVAEYFQSKKIMSTGCPKSYLGLERDVNAKATLSWQDIEFARMLRAIQGDMAGFQRTVYDMQLELLGRQPEEGLYEIEYPAISFVDEQMRASVEQVRWQIAGLARGLEVPLRWILLNILKLPEEDVEEIILNREPGPKAAAPAPAFGPQTPGADAGAESLERVRERVFANAELSKNVAELRDMIYVIQAERLNRPVKF
jgi:ribosomal protein L12E/L44/L45/RPP1/RPP2